MFSRMRTSIAVGLVAVIPIAGCGGGDSTGPKAEQLTSAEAFQVASAVFEELSTALESAGFSSANASKAAKRASMALASTTTLNTSGNCTRGGKITYTGSFTDNTNSQGTGLVTETGTFTPVGCVVSTGTRNISIDGNPNLSWNFNMNFVQFAQSGNATWTFGGGFRWSGGSCDMNYTMTFTPSFAGTISGTICGQSVSQSF